ncbi:hypothetical protein GCM10027445_53680 [Amycolatopsis endophytica]|uniref:Uncharacterized protein n=1 Tax=Amycolatopsis endophytica TaxID=860233 RepID=A0A853AVW9_9PSEU|nr:hypothetical protein [Amycolatopsis endophytica]
MKVPRQAAGGCPGDELLRSVRLNRRAAGGGEVPAWTAAPRGSPREAERQPGVSRVRDLLRHPRQPAERAAAGGAP